MHRTLAHLTTIEQQFIDLAYVQKVCFDDVARHLNVPRSAVTQLNKKLSTDRFAVTKARDLWQSKKIIGNFWDFYNWYTNTEKRCHYCHITQSELNKLHELGIENKRVTRGRSFELDRKIPNEQYSYIHNLVYACYWCNNAKTDTFTEEEGAIIGTAIATIWKQRLGQFK